MGKEQISVTNEEFGSNNFEKLGKGASAGDLKSATDLQAEMQKMQKLMQTMTPEERNTYRVAMNDQFKQHGVKDNSLPKLEFMQDGSLRVTTAQDYVDQKFEPGRQRKGWVQFNLDGMVQASNPGPFKTDLSRVPEGLDAYPQPERNPLPEEMPSSPVSELHRTPAGADPPVPIEFEKLATNAAIESGNEGKALADTSWFKKLGFVSYDDIQKGFAEGAAKGMGDLEGKLPDSDVNDPVGKAGSIGEMIGSKLKDLSLSKPYIQALAQRLSEIFRKAMEHEM